VTVDLGDDGTARHDDSAVRGHARPDELGADDATPPRGVPAFDDTESTPPRGLPILGGPQDDADVQDVDFSHFRSDR
jgi:hypothetical protein